MNGEINLWKLGTDPINVCPELTGVGFLQCKHSPIVRDTPDMASSVGNPTACSNLERAKWLRNTPILLLELIFPSRSN